MKDQPIMCKPHDLVIAWKELDPVSGEPNGALNVYYLPFDEITHKKQTYAPWHKHPFPIDDSDVDAELRNMVKRGVVLASIDKNPESHQFGLACYLLNLSAVKLDEKKAKAIARVEQERLISMADEVLTERYKDRLGKDVKIEQIIESLIQDSEK